MKRKRKTTVSILLAVMMVLTMWIPVSAVSATSAVSAAEQNEVTLSAVLDPISITTADAGQTVTLTLQKDQEVQMSAMGFTVDYNPDVLTLDRIEGNGGSISIGSGDVNLDNGKVSWLTEDMENISVPEETLAVVILTLKEDVAADTYQLGFKEIGLGADYGMKMMVTDGSAYADLTVKANAADPVNKADLEKAIADAQSDLDGTPVSEDGSDVEKTDKWVPQGAADALKEAVESAQAVMDNTDATKEQVDQALSALQAAMADFTTAKQNGTKEKPKEPPQTGQVSDSTDWNGVDADVSWYLGHEEDTAYTIDTAAKLAGAAALVNGLVNEDCHVYISETEYYPAGWWNEMENGFVLGNDEEERADSQNKATAAYHYGIEDFRDKTLTLAVDLDMGGQQDENGDWSGPNYMPLGGQYLMTKNDSATKLSSSFCGTFDGGGHYVRNIYCDRHCSTGNFGDGQSVGFIGRLGVHDNDPAELRPTEPTVKNLGVSGYIYGNRSVGGIVGKTGKTSYNSGEESTGSIISGCVNYATVRNTDAKGCGGIVGAFWNGGLMENCYNVGEISTTYACPTAGLAGSNENAIANSYNIGSITATKDSYAMALGTNNGGAPIKVIANCWYLDGSAPGGGYYSRNTAENGGAMTSDAMKTDEFVTILGDAFTKDSDNINNGYPILKWQGGTEPTPAVDKTALNDTITAAQSDRDATKVSTDGSDVEKTDQWVPQSAADVLKEAIEAAQAVKDNPDATQDEVDEAADALKQAQKAFDEAKKDGIKADDHDANCPGRAFSDLDTGKWYHEAIDYVLLKNYFNGVGDGRFDPDGTMTRAMFVTVLGRAAGVEADENAHSSFSDVADGKWYTPYVDWAARNDIVKGYDSETFGPDEFVTREQMAAILYRYAKYQKKDISGADQSKFSGFKDKDHVSEWAVEAMTWATGCGLINGMGDGTLAPQETATRSQVAQIIMNYDQKV